MAQETDGQRPQPVEEARSRNLRQLLLRAARIVNRHVVDGLHARGYTDLRSTHTTLLSNMPLAGGTITETAERAGITKQAMGRLAAELEEAGYIRMIDDAADGRAKMLELTKAGARLMRDSLEVMSSLEARYAELIGRDRLRSVVDGLRTFNEAVDDAAKI
jgi:DNA-binding MarR family transcriptional regulator